MGTSSSTFDHSVSYTDGAGGALYVASVTRHGRRVVDGRQSWAWMVRVDASTADDPGRFGSFTGEDLHTTADAEPVEALSTLLTFLGAWVEGVEYAEREGESENADLFPRELYALGDDWESALFDMGEQIAPRCETCGGPTEEIMGNRHCVAAPADCPDSYYEEPDTCLGPDGHWYVVTYGRAPFQIHATECDTCEVDPANAVPTWHPSRDGFGAVVAADGTYLAVGGVTLPEARERYGARKADALPIVVDRPDPS